MLYKLIGRFHKLIGRFHFLPMCCKTLSENSEAFLAVVIT